MYRPVASRASEIEHAVHGPSPSAMPFVPAPSRDDKADDPDVSPAY